MVFDDFEWDAAHIEHIAKKKISRMSKLKKIPNFKSEKEDAGFGQHTIVPFTNQKNRMLRFHVLKKVVSRRLDDKAIYQLKKSRIVKVQDIFS